MQRAVGVNVSPVASTNRKVFQRLSIVLNFMSIERRYMESKPSCTKQKPSSGPSGGPTLLLAVLYGAAFVAAFNENIVNVALVDIMSEFSVSSVSAQWLVTGYMIVASIMVALTAFLLHRFSLRALFFSAAFLLIVGSAAAACARSFAFLLAMRLVQALGTGVFIPSMMSTVLRVAPRERLGTFLSIGGCCITLGPAFGPVVSGVMVTVFGWRFAFAPVCAAMALLAALGLFCVRHAAPEKTARLDVLSLALSALGLTVFVFGLTRLLTDTAMAVACVSAGAVLIWLFARRQDGLETPLLNMSPLRNGRFAISCALSVIAMMTTFSMSVLLPLYFQGAYEMTALASGALILVPIAVNALTALAGGRIMDKRGEWPLLPAGFALIALGQVCVCVFGAHVGLASVVAASAVVYAGVGLVFSPSQTAGLKTLSAQENSYGVSIMNTLIQVAGSLGPSLFVGIMSAVEQMQIVSAPAQMAQAEGFAASVGVAAAIACLGCVCAYMFARAERLRAGEPAQRESVQMR